MDSGGVNDVLGWTVLRTDPLFARDAFSLLNAFRLRSDHCFFSRFPLFGTKTLSSGAPFFLPLPTAMGLKQPAPFS